MDKIIKPLLDENGQHIRRKLKEGDYYWAEGLKTFIQYKFWTSELEHFVYYEEKWKPKENEFYWFYNFLYENAIEYKRNSYTDALNLAVGNCFQTKEEAEDITNILTVLNNMKKYYIDCIDLKGGKIE